MERLGIRVSPTTSFEFIVDHTVSEEASENMAQGYFCLTAQAPGSSYDYMPGPNVHAGYDRILYYDSMMRGIFTMEELVEAYNSDRDMVCQPHAIRWLEATS